MQRNQTKDICSIVGEKYLDSLLVLSCLEAVVASDKKKENTRQRLSQQKRNQNNFFSAINITLLQAYSSEFQIIRLNYE